MSIHISRDNQLKGVGSPNMAPSYYGQPYIDTGANPRGVWISTSENVSGWTELSPKGHKHTVADFTNLTTEITKIVQEQGIEAALLSLKGGTNTWEGAWNNFTGELRQNGKNVLTQGSSIGDLGDVDITTGLKANALLGWNGSTFVPYEVTGASPSDGGIDFSQYLRKDSLVTGIGSGDQTAPLAASVATLLYNRVKDEFATKTHTHTEYAAANHTHTNYLDTTKAGSLKNQLNLGGAAGNNTPLTISGQYGRAAFEFSENQAGPTILSFQNTAGSEVTEAMISGAAGAVGGRLTLNFSEVHVPTGGFTIGENKKYMTIPSLKITSEGQTYIGEMNRTFGLDLNNSALIGASQIAFKVPSKGRQNAILFPKNYAGNTQPTDIGLYHYLRMLDGELQTDTALASDARYIRLGGVKIFFSATDPGKEASDGDIWIKI
ncbi:MAG: hypothetical protein ABS916_09180 [Carnobacterium sp.]|uniref:hypothetical protein n=1 Tax=Carnobacterium sp. TaxID=48221 RepID=UPI0033153CCC